MTDTQNLPARQQSRQSVPDSPPVLANSSGTLKSLLERAKESIAAALPRHLTPDRLIKVVLVAVSRSETLGKCTAHSILQCVMTGAQLGLDCSGVLGSAYMVPFWNKKIGAFEAVFIPGYRGLIDLARRSGEIVSIEAHVVYEGDAFEIEFGTATRVVHRPNLENVPDDSKIIGAYMVAKLQGDAHHVEFMTRKEIERIKSLSKAKDYGPWVDHFGEMCRKTVVKRGVKYLPLSIEAAEAIRIDDENLNRIGGVVNFNVDDSGSATPPANRAAALTEKIKARSEITDPFGQPVEVDKQLPSEEEAERILREKSPSAQGSGDPPAEQAGASVEREADKSVESGKLAADEGLAELPPTLPESADEDWFTAALMQRNGCVEEVARKICRIKLPKPFKKLDRGEQEAAYARLLAGEMKL